MAGKLIVTPRRVINDIVGILPQLAGQRLKEALAAGAARTKTIRLTSAVTVLSSEDPVRVFQQYATLDGISGGRAEVILGRGSFTESFPLFGYALEDYERLFEEKLDLFARLVREPEVTWQGQIRPALTRQRVFPTLSTPLPVWVGVGGSPESVVRVVRQDLQLMLAIIGGVLVAAVAYWFHFKRTEHPILDLRPRGADLHRYLRCLEDVVLDVCTALGLRAERWPGRTGVTGPKCCR